MIDRYTKVVLTLIACALLYLCVIFTPLPRAHAQVPSRTPGEPSGPTDVVVVGWRAPGEATVPVRITHSVPVTSPQPLRITGEVTTERSSPRPLADRVILVGWEEDASGNRISEGRFQSLNDSQASPNRRLPVTLPK
jgi:hypothetical protein